MEETAYLLRSRANAARLAEATAQAQRGEPQSIHLTAREDHVRPYYLGGLRLLAFSRPEDPEVLSEAR